MSASPTSRKGTIGELAVTQQLLGLEYDVFKEVTGSSEIDLVAYKNSKFTRIQVKTSTSKNELVVFEACKQHDHTRPYIGDEFDVMALYVTDRNVVLYVTLKKLTEYTRGMSVRFEKSTKYFNTTNYASDYLVFPNDQ